MRPMVFFYNCTYYLFQVLFDEDREVIKTLSTLENVRLLCQDDKMEVPAMPSPRRGRPHDVYRSGLHSVLRVPFRYDLVGLLARCDRTELLLSTFVQEFSFPAVTGHDQVRGDACLVPVHTHTCCF